MDDLNYKICSNCVMDTTDPDISFNEDGICNRRKFNEVTIKNWFPTKEGKRKLDGIIKNIKKTAKIKNIIV